MPWNQPVSRGLPSPVAPPRLQRINDRISKGRFLIARQEAVIKRRRRSGLDTAASIELLIELCQAVQDYRRIRSTLVRTQDSEDDQPWSLDGVPDPARLAAVSASGSLARRLALVDRQIARAERRKAMLAAAVERGRETERSTATLEDKARHNEALLNVWCAHRSLILLGPLSD